MGLFPVERCKKGQNRTPNGKVIEYFQFAHTPPSTNRKRNIFYKTGIYFEISLRAQSAERRRANVKFPSFYGLVYFSARFRGRSESLKWDISPGGGNFGNISGAPRVVCDDLQKRSL